MRPFSHMMNGKIRDYTNGEITCYQIVLVCIIYNSIYVDTYVIEVHFIPELKRKTLQECFWNDELHQEILEMKMTFLTRVTENKQCMMEIDRLHLQQLYPHVCHPMCKERGRRSCILFSHIMLLNIGCGKLIVTDGIWKLSYPICLFKVPIYVEQIQINPPDCCQMEPELGKLFCKKHSKELKDAGLPDNLLGFIKKIKDVDVIALGNECMYVCMCLLCECDQCADITLCMWVFITYIHSYYRMISILLM